MGKQEIEREWLDRPEHPERALNRASGSIFSENYLSLRFQGISKKRSVKNRAESRMDILFFFQPLEPDRLCFLKHVLPSVLVC